ncbi:nucleolar pre-ribosomal-associated protein 1 [Cephus cinctus]|uniref:Nucleolar pre-ribosomal-associated protein 1 n=1 Tax=Cephus cinctus TaxID=211228 RepID=A0AAJ7FNG5_CEPCN|nr:nucleolar pre-ribosomal-associated protein 1 [Cephus cinctus]XP_015600465.1 nucleolar pre-ribosomal-associated protein 1 [Cephus cinctus]
MSISHETDVRPGKKIKKKAKYSSNAEVNEQEQPINGFQASNKDQQKVKRKKRKADSNVEQYSPQKKSKENDNSTSGVDETINEDKESDREEMSAKEVHHITGKSLRNSFNSAEGLDMLRKFITICQENKQRDLASEYLHAGGSALEVLRLLDTSDKKSINNAMTVFSAMHIVIMKILAQYPQYYSSATEACRHLVNSHLSSVHAMLSAQSNAKHRRVILRLLAAVVSLGGSLPRELLNHLSLHTQVLDALTKHSRPSDSQSVRTCFIHFVLAFLVEGNITTIRALLDKRGLLSSIFPNLVYDSHTNVHLVLTTVRTYVLENPGISKTIKLHTFSTPVVQSLVSLYNWKGPKNWPGYKKHGSATSDVINLEEKEIALEAVHEFLLVLLTSNRHGIIFHDYTLGTSGRKHNQSVNIILQSLDRPWEHAKPLDLVVKILVACPDLVRSQFTYTEPFLEPRVSKKWVSVMQFIKKVIESMDGESCIKSCINELSVSQLISAVIALTMPLSILRKAIVPSLSHDNIIPRHVAMDVFTTMLTKLREFTKIIEDIYKDSSDLSQLKHGIADHILKNAPTLDTILSVWIKAFTPDTDTLSLTDEQIELIPTKSNHLAVILDLLLAYKDTCPGRLEAGFISNSDLQPTVLLTKLNDLANINEEELNDMKVKALQFLLALDSSVFDPSRELFSTVLPFLILLLDSPSSSAALHTRSTLISLLNTSGLFEACDDQTAVWIENFSSLHDANEKLEVANWLVKIIKSVLKHTNKYINQITKAEEIAGEQILSADRIADIFEELASKDAESDNIHSANLQSITLIPPILCAALENLKKNPNEVLLRYISYVTVNTLHYQVAPGTLVHLAQYTDELPARKYLLSWVQDGIPIPIKKHLAPKVVISKLSKVLLGDSNIDVKDIFIGDRKIAFTYNNENVEFTHSLNEYEVLSLLRMTLFYFTQFLQRGNFTAEQNSNYSLVIVSLLHIAKDLSNAENSCFIKECTRWIFTHPVILQYFSPLCKKKQELQKNFTRKFLDILEISVRLNEKHEIAELLLPFKEKTLVQLETAIKKYQNDSKVKNSSMVMEFIRMLQLNIKDIIRLFTIILKLPQENLLSQDKMSLSMWGIIIPNLLEISSKLRGCVERGESLTLDKNIIEKISSALAYLCRSDVDVSAWEISLHKYLLNYPHNIAGIDIGLFKSLMKKALNPKPIEFISFLISRNPKFIDPFIKYITSNKNTSNESDLVFSVLSGTLNCKWDVDFLKRVSQTYIKDIQKFFIEPKIEYKWIEKNLRAVMYIIDTNFDAEFCISVSNTILTNGDKLDAVNINYIELLECLFNKAATLQKNNANPLINFIQILVHITVATLKKESKNTSKLEVLCKKLCSAIERNKSKDTDFALPELSKNYSWPQFTRFSLKLGLKSSKAEKQESPLLKTLSALCNVAYKDNEEHEYIKTLFEMTVSHSEFINIMLSSSATKRDLVELLWVLVRKNNSVMAMTQIPLYLAAYNATLSESDQFILMLLRYYESHNIRLNDYQPYLWGNAAATHYSVKGEMDTALWRQPSTSQVLDLFSNEIVNNTIRNYPVHRSLKCEENVQAEDSVYDPAFYLPLLSYLLSDNNVVACHKVTKSGALALALLSCSSICEQTRMAGFTVISRFYFHLEATSSKEKLLWMHFVDSLKNGIALSESGLRNIRLSSLVTTFLARTSLVTTQPLNPLYSPLQSFLMAKPALDINTIPEFLQLFHSSEIEHEAHRHWILRVIRDGIKTEADMEMALKCFLFKMLLDFYSCALSTSKTKILILEVLESTVKLQKAAWILVSGYALLPWLHEAAESIDSRDMELFNTTVSLLKNLLKSIPQNHLKSGHARTMILSILLTLKSRLPKNVSLTCYTNYIEALKNTLTNKNICKGLSKKDVKDIIDMSKKLLGSINDCEDMLTYSCEFSVKTSDSLSNDELTIAKISLKELIFTWYNHRIK